MSEATAPVVVPVTLPDHKQLPETDGSIVNNYQEHPQSALLTSSLRPHLEALHADGQFSIGQDSGIYWRVTQPPLDGCKAPDWFYVPGVPPLLAGEVRRSYVLWQEIIPPLLVVEYVSGDGSEEHDRTPFRGKFWVYETAIRAGYYLIFDRFRGTLEGYRQNGAGYHPLEPNTRGRLTVEPMGVEFGLWEGYYHGYQLLWLRAWDLASGAMLLTGEELAECNRLRAEQEQKRAEEAEELLDDSRRMLEEEVERAETERKRAETERKRAEAEHGLAVQANERATQANERATQANERATQANERAAKLAEQLRALGIDPDAA